MPRYFNSLAEATAGIRGHKGRNAFAVAQREARQAELNSSDTLARVAHLRLATEDHRLRNVITSAEDHVAKLRGRLAAAQREVDHMAEASYRSGIVSADLVAARRQLDGLPDLIARAERELAAACAALAAHRATVAVASAVKAAPIDAEPVAEPEPSKGRGRPPKVSR